MCGTGAGNSFLISASLLNGQITITHTDGTALAAGEIDITSVYRVYQLGSFPRDRDVFYNTFQTPTFYYKVIPEKVREATAAQCEYINKMGLNYFISDDSYISSEHIGPYSYQKNIKALGTSVLIAPKARMLLRGLMNRKGIMVV